MSSPDPQSPMRLWYQSYVDDSLARPYLHALRAHLDQVKGPATSLHLHELSPPDSYAHPLMEFRCARAVVRNAIRAEREGYDAVLLGHIQDSGLWEARAAVRIPVLGLGEVSMLHACMLGTRAGIVTINTRFIPGFRQQIRRYGLELRVPFVDAVDHQPGDFMRSFESPQDAARVVAEFTAQARKIVDQGADVLIPGGGIPMLLLDQERVRTIAGAPVLNGLPVLVRMAEMAVQMRRLCGLEASRLADFKLPPPDVIEEFLAH
ncbi:MAG TPA: aspartate/glutamate racemase family protein [Steroidobacteraceae bacterium]|nr:aspartate/glutamate racemase family protein [Steroidobacteraceae bacterium]